MVVTRRVPVPPAPPTSRSSSSQSTPRISRNRAPFAQQLGDTPDSRTLPDDKNIPPLTSKNKRDIIEKDSRSGSFFSSFSFLILTLFSLYALSSLHPSPVESFRHAISIPHDNLIKPYFLPPLKAALSHPTVEPHVKNLRTAVQPYTERIESGARPVLEKLSEIEREYVRPLVRRGTKASYFFIRKTWKRTVIPSYNSYLRPHIQPYLNRWNFFYYNKIDHRLRAIINECTIRYRELKPRVDIARRNARRYSDNAYSKIAPRIHHFYKSVQPHVITLWTEAQPHVIASWKFLRVQAIRGVSALRIYGTMAAVRLGDARREFVDPHIKQIWEKVESRSLSINAETTSSPVSVNPVSPTPAELPMDEPTSEAISDASSVSEEVAATPLPEPSEHIVGSYVVVTPSRTSDESSTAAPTITESVGLGVAAEIVTADGTDEDVVMDLPAPSVIPQAESPTPRVPPSQKNDLPAQAPVTSEADENVDDFLLQLGIVSDEQSDAQKSDTAQEENHRALFMKQEAEAARRAEIASKRAEIVNRHANWKTQLDELFIARERDLRKALVNIRKRAVEELRSLTVHYGQENKRGKPVDSIEQVTGQLVKGVEAYLKKERERKEKLGHEWNDELEDRRGQWVKVMDRVTEKYEEGVSSVLEQVQRWYIGIKDTEVNEVFKTFSELKSLAEEAQKNLGLDYAWLDDVTYQDWQNYHDLLKTAEHFKSVAEAIQNGTHAHPPVDPLVPALNILQEELQEVVFGARAQLSMQRSEGNELYMKWEPETPTTGDDEPTVSILPIKGDSQDSTLLDFSDAILGKSEEQIKQALNAAGFNVNEEQADNHVEL